MTAVQRNGFNSEKPNLNKKIVQLTHSELDIKNKKSLKKVKMEGNFQMTSGKLKQRTTL